MADSVPRLAVDVVATIERAATGRQVQVARRFYALGLDQELLTYPHERRSDTLTDVVVTNAAIVPELLA
jgi:hypothetical protein